MSSPLTVQNLQKAQSAFDQYLTTAIANLANRVSPLETKFQTYVTNFYKNSNITDPVVYGSDAKTHFCQVAEFNVDFIEPAVKTVATGLFAGNSLPGGGSNVLMNALDASAKAALLTFDPMVDAAVVCIAAVIGLISTSTTADYGESMRSQHLGPGLMLHAYGLADEIHDQRWFNDDSLVESAMGYQLIYSNSMYLNEAKKAAVDLYVNEFASDAKTLLAVNQVYNDAEMTYISATGKAARDAEQKMTKCKLVYNELTKRLQKLEKSVGVTLPGVQSLSPIP